MNTTIAAIATGGGRGAIAIIRVSGPKSLNVYHSLTRLRSKPQPNQLNPAWLYEGVDKLDHGMIVYFASPRSFTGEDMLEIHSHGSEAVTSRIMMVLEGLGVQPAKPGEFSERAYYNNKIDITQAEAIMELVAAENTQTARLATKQLAGEFSSKIKNLNSKVTSLAASTAADIDFSEEDIPGTTTSKIAKEIKSFVLEIQNIKAGSELLPKLKNGVSVVLVGLPNAGKSTLLNTLLGFERSIVTEIAGTTRDTVSERVELDGINYQFIDTAGLNDNPDKIEKIGIIRSHQAIESADVVLLLVEPNKIKATKNYLKDNGMEDILNDKRTILVYTKSDIHSPPTSKFSISAKNKKGMPELISKIKHKSKVNLTSDINILTSRQLNLLNEAEVLLADLYDNLSALTVDIISAELEAVINILNELTGVKANQQIIDSVFRNFCIGK